MLLCSLWLPCRRSPGRISWSLVIETGTESPESSEVTLSTWPFFIKCTIIPALQVPEARGKEISFSRYGVPAPSHVPSPGPAPSHVSHPPPPSRPHSHGQHLHFQDFVPQLQASCGVIFKWALVKLKVPRNQQGQKLLYEEARQTLGGLRGSWWGQVDPGQINRAHQTHPSR